jgi:hypothetical protein
VEDFAFVLAVAFVSRSCHQGPLSESCGGNLVPPTIYSIPLCQTIDLTLSDHDSLFELPDSSGRQGAQSAQR